MNIGYSCSLLRDDMEEVFVISGATSQDVQHQLRWSRVTYLPLHTHTQAAGTCLNITAQIPTELQMPSLCREAKGHILATSRASWGEDGGPVDQPHYEEAVTEEFALVINGHSLVVCVGNHARVALC